jgi:two-component system NtrC family response regulator/two-component system response regulator HydG
VEDAVRAMKLGAYDYLQKPFDFNLIKMLLEKIVEHRRIIKASRVSPDDQRKRYRFENIIGQDRKMFKIYEMINDVAETTASVLITGESGSGKELIAEAIHYRSNRRNNPFYQVNCAALTESIINSELFGHEKGAFTGADDQKIGMFEKSHGGTLLLDEIGDIPLQTQVSLLRVLETGTFQRVGSTQTVQVDTRILCATNQDLSTAIQDKRFREDLFYRINVVSIDVPPLRERTLDIPLLASYFIEKYSLENDKNIKEISKSAIKILNQYQWPGNVRELGNVINHALIFCKTGKIQPADLPDNIKQAFQNKTFNLTLTSPSLPLAEATLIQKVLDENHWNLKQAAMALEIARGTLYSKIKKYKLKKTAP